MRFDKQHTCRFVLMTADAALIGQFNKRGAANKTQALDIAKREAQRRGKRLGIIYMTDLDTSECGIYTPGGSNWLRHQINKTMEDVTKQDNSAAVEIGRKLKMLRVERGMLAKDVCERAGIKHPTLTAIEGGRYNTGIRQITDVAKALGAHVEIVKD